MSSSNPTNYYDQFRSPSSKSQHHPNSPKIDTTPNGILRRRSVMFNEPPIAPPLSPESEKQFNQKNLHRISEIKSESALVRRQRLAADALKQLQGMQIHLGFSFDAVNENDNPYLGLLVDSVEPNAPADKAGVKAKDVVLEVNGKRVLTLQDLMDSIKGLVAGTPIQFIVERNEQEIEIIVTLGGRDQDPEEISRLYALVQSVQSGSDELMRTGALSLSDVLETPQFRYCLLQYMATNLCAESVLFLQVEQAYQGLNREADLSRRGYLAHIIADTYISEDGDQMVNIDADTRKSVLVRLNEQNDTSPLLFHDAAKVVYKMCENDVFRRFVNSELYQNMVQDPSDYEQPSMRGKHRRTASFSVIAFEDNDSMLEEIALSFSKTPAVKDQRLNLKKYKAAFRGSDLVNWLIEAGYSKNRPSAVSIGQRLWDAFYMRHIIDEAEFEDSDKLYTFLSGFDEAISAQQLVDKSGGDNGVSTCYVLVKGVRYNRLYCVITKEKKKLWLFRNEEAIFPLLKFRVKGSTFWTQQGPEVALEDSNPSSSTGLNSMKGLAAVANALSSPTGSTSSFASRNSFHNNNHNSINSLLAEANANTKHKRELITYLHLDDGKRTLTFRLETLSTAQTFQANLVKIGAVQVLPPK